MEEWYYFNYGRSNNFLFNGKKCHEIIFFPYAKIKDNALVWKKPDYVILHVCTNDGPCKYGLDTTNGVSQPAITCSKLIIETLAQGVKHLQS